MWTSINSVHFPLSFVVASDSCNNTGVSLYWDIFQILIFPNGLPTLALHNILIDCFSSSAFGNNWNFSGSFGLDFNFTTEPLVCPFTEFYPASVNSLVTTDRVLYNHYSRKRDVWCYKLCPVVVKRLHFIGNVRPITTRRRKQRYIFKYIAYQFLPFDGSVSDVFSVYFKIGTVKNNAIAILKNYVLSLQSEWWDTSYENQTCQ